MSTTRTVRHHLEVYSDDPNIPDFTVESDAPFGTFSVGDYWKGDPIAGFGSDGFKDRIKHLLHYTFAARQNEFHHKLMVYLEPDDFWQTGQLTQHFE